MHRTSAGPPWRRPSIERPGRAWLALRDPGSALALTLVLMLAGASGCGPEPTDQEPPGLSREAFVEVVVALREAERAVAGQDSAEAEFEERKRAILEEHDVTETDLRQYAEVHGSDIELMDAVWDTIAQRLRYLPDESGVQGREFRVESPQ